MDIQIKQVCHWTFEPEGYYETECGSANVFNEGGPDENEYRFCPFCGKTLIHNPLEMADA